MSLISWIGDAVAAHDRDGGVPSLVGVPVADACSFGHLAEAPDEGVAGFWPDACASNAMRVPPQEVHQYALLAASRLVEVRQVIRRSSGGLSCRRFRGLAE